MKKTLLVLVAMVMGSSAAFADHKKGDRYYDVTITNITSGQTFTPLLVATHKRSISFFEAGMPAIDELATIAFNLGAFRTIFFDDLLTAWTAISAILIAALLQLPDHAKSEPHGPDHRDRAAIHFTAIQTQPHTVVVYSDLHLRISPKYIKHINALCFTQAIARRGTIPR